MANSSAISVDDVHDIPYVIYSNISSNQNINIFNTKNNTKRNEAFRVSDVLKSA